MDFGKYLDRHVVAEWSTQYVRYKRLNQLIKQIAIEAIEGDSGSFSEDGLYPPSLSRLDSETNNNIRQRRPPPHQGKNRSRHLSGLGKKQPTNASDKSKRPNETLHHPTRESLNKELQSEHAWIERSRAHVVAMEEQVEMRTRVQEGRMVRRVSESNLSSASGGSDRGSNNSSPQLNAAASPDELVFDEGEQDEAALDLALNGGKDLTDVNHVPEDARMKRLTFYIPSWVSRSFTPLQQTFFKMLEEDLDTINHFFLKQENFFLSKINVIVSQLDRLIQEEEHKDKERVKLDQSYHHRHSSHMGSASHHTAPFDTKSPPNTFHTMPQSAETLEKQARVRDALQQNVDQVAQMSIVHEQIVEEVQLQVGQPATQNLQPPPLIPLETDRLLSPTPDPATLTAPVASAHSLTSPLDQLATASQRQNAPAIGHFLTHNLPAQLSHLSHALKDSLPHYSPSLQAPFSRAREHLDSIAHRAQLLLKVRLLTAEDPWAVLEKALQQLYRGLHLLRNFKILNYTAMAKLLRKYDHLQLHPLSSTAPAGMRRQSSTGSMHHLETQDTSNDTLQVVAFDRHRGSSNNLLTPFSLQSGYWNACAELLPRINSTHFLASPILKTFIRKVEMIFASTFTDGDHRIAKNNLRVTRNRLEGSVMLGLGLCLGIGVVAFLLLMLMITWVATQLQANINLTLNVSLPVWRCLALILIHLLGWGINVSLFHKYRINHTFIFDIDPHTELRFQQILLIVAVFSVVWFTLLDAYLFVELVKSAGQWTGALTGFFPFLLFVIFFFLVFNPFNFFFQPTRYYLLQVLFKIVAAPFYSVDFKHFYTADQLCSLVNVMNDFMYSFCWFSSGHFVLQEQTSDSWCLAAQKQTVWVIAALPYWWRLLQCLRKYRDNPPQNGRQLWNAGKYMSSICTTMLSLCNKNFPGSAFYPLWILSAIFTTCYTAYWDLAFDWGIFVFEGPSLLRLKPRFFPRKLVLPSHTPYYFAMISNIVLRLTWVLTISPSNFGLPIPAAYFSTIIWTLEVIRRNQWNFYRLENEHLTNCENYRVVNIVPLKMDINPALPPPSAIVKKQSDGPSDAGTSPVTISGMTVDVKKIDRIRKNMSMEDLSDLLKEHHSAASVPLPPSRASYASLSALTSTSSATSPNTTQFSGIKVAPTLQVTAPSGPSTPLFTPRGHDRASSQADSFFQPSTVHAAATSGPSISSTQGSISMSTALTAPSGDVTSMRRSSSVHEDLHLLLTEILTRDGDSELTAPDAFNADPDRHDDPEVDQQQLEQQQQEASPSPPLQTSSMGIRIRSTGDLRQMQQYQQFNRDDNDRNELTTTGSALFRSSKTSFANRH